jgi:hypothetical protein
MLIKLFCENEILRHRFSVSHPPKLPGPIANLGVPPSGMLPIYRGPASIAFEAHDTLARQQFSKCSESNWASSTSGDAVLFDRRILCPMCLNLCPNRRSTGIAQ